MADEIKALSFRLGEGGKVTDAVVSHFMDRHNFRPSYQSMAVWLYFGTGACFLQDADNLIMKTRDLVEILEFLKEKFPEINRITTYARSRTIIRKSIESLTKIRNAGLNRIHVGLETGHDPLLKLMKKGVSASQHIEAGQKVIRAGMELSEYVMPGLGGQEMWREHAVDTAKVLNAINPHFIRLRSLRIPKRIPLYQMLEKGEFTMQTDDSVAEEIRLFIDTLDGITSVVTSDHSMNLLEEVAGKFPEDKEKILTVIKKYQELPDSERIIYRLGRRGGAYRSTDDLQRDPSSYEKLKRLVEEVKDERGEDGLEAFIKELADRYV
jgi:radical SAM superfamily enzyme YgiQ (UPF0313 family)